MSPFYLKPEVLGASAVNNVSNVNKGNHNCFTNSKQKQHCYWSSMRQFIKKHRCSTVHASPALRSSFQRTIHNKLYSPNASKFCYINIVNLHMCEMKIKKHVLDVFDDKYTVINEPTYIRLD